MPSYAPQDRGAKRRPIACAPLPRRSHLVRGPGPDTVCGRSSARRGVSRVQARVRPAWALSCWRTVVGVGTPDMRTSPHPYRGFRFRTEIIGDGGSVRARVKRAGIDISSVRRPERHVTKVVSQPTSSAQRQQVEGRQSAILSRTERPSAVLGEAGRELTDPASQAATRGMRSSMGCRPAATVR
jgi:hypothetical protein